MAKQYDALGNRLKELRTRLGVTQVDLARALGVGQTALSHLEDRDDIHASKVVEYVEALGGRLEIVARFQTLGPVKLLHPHDTDEQVISPPIEQPPIPGLEAAPLPRDVILSIKPIYADQILSGKKTVEVRRRFTQGAKGSWALIYSTTPDRALTGAAKIVAVDHLATSTLWKKHRDHAGIAKKDFDEYFSGTDMGYAIKLEAPIAFESPMPLSELRSRFGFEPPQSYQYAPPTMSRLIHFERAKAPN